MTFNHFGPRGNQRGQKNDLLTVFNIRTPGFAPFALAAPGILILTLLLSASCGSEASEAGLDDVVFSEIGLQGQGLYNESGCSACHGLHGVGGVGPTLAGIAGTEISLVDGGSVPAGTAYLERAILDPGADLVAGFTIKMPNNQLTEAEAASVIRYIEELK